MRDRVGAVALFFRSCVMSAKKAALIAFLFAARSSSIDERFRKAWRCLDVGSFPTRYLRRRQSNFVRHQLHYNLRHFFRRYFGGFVTRVTLADRNVVADFGSKPTIIATIHSNTEFGLCRALDEAGVQTAFITTEGFDPGELAAYEFQRRPIEIRRAPDMFLKARQALAEGQVFVCDVDWSISRGPRRSDFFVSPTLFDFARRIRAQLFFAHSRITRDGEIVCTIERYGATDRNDPSATAADFIAFVERLEGRRLRLAIAPWPW